MDKKNIITLVVLVLVILVIGCLQYKEKHENDYSVVYITTGEIYIGKLTTFPDLELRNSYVLQTVKDTTDPTKTGFQLNPISEALWAPQVLHFNKNSVIFYGPLMEDSKITQTIVAKK